MEWIDTENMPKDGQIILASFHKLNKKGGFIDLNFPNWIVGNVDYTERWNFVAIRKNKVFFWMPLPKPPFSSP